MILNICKPNAIDPPFADGFYMYQPFLVSHWRGFIVWFTKVDDGLSSFSPLAIWGIQYTLRQTRRIPQVYSHGRAERQDLDTDGWLRMNISHDSHDFPQLE